MYEQPKILPVGDRAILVEFGDEISVECNTKVLSLYASINTEDYPYIVSTIPTYRSLLIKYNPLEVNYNNLLKMIEENLKTQKAVDIKPKVVEIPVKYGEDYGPDIDFVAEHNNLSVEEVINIHTDTFYRIYMIGFTMGFAYLGGMDERIETPRLERPRTKIPSGSVGIAGKQTGIYPIESPGGWRLIGKTPVKLYDPYREKPILLEPGNYIKFVKITEKEFLEIEDKIKNGEYEITTYDYKLQDVGE